MDCNKEEALRAKDIAEKKMERRDFMGARKIALKAQQLYPDLENIAQMLFVCDVHCSAELKLFGNEMDWYRILQLEQTANDLMIKKQYKKFALQLHPDKNKFSGAEAAFKLIGEAQRVLLDKDKRTIHDMKRRVPMNKTATSRHSQQKAPMNFNSAVKTNVKPSFTNLNAQQQQQQSRTPVQQRHNYSRPTFWTVCPFCSVKYQYYREVLNKPLRCQQCNRPFIAYDVDMQNTSPATNSSQKAFGHHLNHDAFKMGAGFQGNLHAEKSNTEPYDNKGTTDVSRKPNGKRKSNQVAESSESSDSTGSTDSEDNMVAGEDGFPGVEDHSTYREEHPRRSTRQKHQVSYEENASDNDEVKRNHLYSEENLLNRNKETKKVRGKEAVGDSKHVDETSEHPSPYSVSKAANHPNIYVYPDAEFSDFGKDRKKECFAAGQTWAIYDTAEGMPRFYALIRKVLSPGFKLRITWFEPSPDDDDEINWVNEELPVACGKYKLGGTDTTEDYLMFSHLILSEKIGRNTFKVYPKKGETWALFKNWDIKWHMDVESHQQYEYEFVEVLSDYVEGEGVSVAYLAKLKGFVCLFSQITMEDNQSFQIPPVELFRFSHRVPSFKMTGEEGVGVHIGSYELDPAALPTNIEEIAVPENLDVKAGHSSKPLMTSEGDDVSISKVDVERSNLADEVKDSIDDIDDGHAPPASAPEDIEIPAASTPEDIEIPEPQFFNFDAGRSLEKFQIGQIWAFYSDEDGLPKYYGQVNVIKTSPVLELRVYWLNCCGLPENTTEWEDKDMLISCGRFKVSKTVANASIYRNTSCVSHQVHADAVGKNKNYYAIFPRKGEVWALYRNWSSKIKYSDLKNWEYDIVEVLEETDLFMDVLVLEFVSGFSSVFRAKSNDGSAVNLRIPRKELLRFSHQIPAFKLTEEHGSNLRGFWELDPGALPIHYYGSR
ncbi:uncharacterized protein LOC133310960 [Gastrolobium bilobum]|uniref:uncharacterized protein LOC133310960 n=1 Tax=Gastrolobium bilobum TaxID=150636 RepID=UPI002AB2FA92|nr:uncharacterized protein LOC133310960 [Gastrolobium bilobum]